METTNKYMSIAYKMYTTNNDETKIEEATADDKPFVFITGFGVAMPAFEEAVKDLNTGDSFAFDVTADKAFGQHYDERILQLDKEIFSVDGHFDSENVRLDAIIPLKNEDGNVFMGRVLEIGADKITIDLNHPLAGKDLHFEGTVKESREATNEEIQSLANQLSGEGCCGGNCGGCHSGKEKGCGGCGNC